MLTVSLLLLTTLIDPGDTEGADRKEAKQSIVSVF